MFLENGNIYEGKEIPFEISKIPGYKNTYGYLQGYYDEKTNEENLFLSIYNKDKKIFEEYNFEKEGYKELKKNKTMYGRPRILSMERSIVAEEEDGKIYMHYEESYEGEVKIIDTEKKEIRNIKTWIPSNSSYLSKNLVRDGKIYNIYSDNSRGYKLIEYDTVNKKRKELCSIEDISSTYNIEKKEKIEILKGFFLKREK